MPGAQGFNALVHVRGRPRGLPVVVVSATDDAETIAGALRFGAQASSRSRPRPRSSAAPSRPCSPARSTRRPASGRSCHVLRGGRSPRRATRRRADPPAVRVLGMLCAGMLNNRSLRPRRLGSDRQGARHGDPAQAGGGHADAAVLAAGALQSTGEHQAAAEERRLIQARCPGAGSPARRAAHAAPRLHGLRSTVNPSPGRRSAAPPSGRP